MKKAIYISSISSVSPQNTFDNSVFLNQIVSHKDTTITVIAPDYKAFIPPAAARRMAKGIKMSMASAKTVLSEANLKENDIDAIIVGTGLGCIGDSEKFLSAIIDNKEQYLTPTRFIQSSHNTVAGQIALGIACKGHNFTYVHSAISFESALLDAKMQLELNEAQHIIVGGVDELVAHHVDTHRLIKHIKEEPVETMSLLNSGTKGAVFGEGANFFVVSNEKQTTSHSQLIALTTYNTLSKEKVSDKISSFIKDQGIEINDVDLVIMGNNGDIEFDNLYDELNEGIFKNTPQAYFKHLSGEFDTASGFGFWLGNKILKTQSVPDVVKLNSVKPNKLETILIYNQYRGENHSLVLLKKC